MPFMIYSNKLKTKITISMTELIDIDREIEIVELRVKRRNLLLKECTTDSQSKTNLKARQRVSAKLFDLTNNPIYIHF
jgi:hypothetical protein